MQCFVPSDLSKIYPLKQVVNQGEDAEFSCFTSTTTVWTLNGNGLPSNVDIVTSPEKFVTLHINKVTTANRGMYECTSTDNDGSCFIVAGLLIVRGKLYSITMSSGAVNANFLREWVHQITFNSHLHLSF